MPAWVWRDVRSVFLLFFFWPDCVLRCLIDTVIIQSHQLALYQQMEIRFDRSSDCCNLNIHLRFVSHRVTFVLVEVNRTTQARAQDQASHKGRAIKAVDLREACAVLCLQSIWGLLE